MKMVLSGRPCGWRRISSPESIAPTVRLTLRTSSQELHLLAALERRRALLDQAHVERLGEAVVLRLDVAARHLGRRRRRLEQAAEVEAARLPVGDALLRVEQVDAADQLVERADAELRHDRARFLGDEEEEVDDVLGPALELARAAPGPASPRRPGRC